MNEIVIKKFNFDSAKKHLKEFSEKTEADFSIKAVKESRFLGFGNHKVTGCELNNIIQTIQNHFIYINSINNKTIKEFGEIYNALDALDTEYLTSIVASVKAIEKTSNDVRVQQGVLSKHSIKLKEHQNKLDLHQDKINKNIINLEKTVNALKKFKEKLDGFEHLTDIDKIWSDFKKIENDLKYSSDYITKFSKKINTDIAVVNSQNKEITKLVNQEFDSLNNDTNLLKDGLSELVTKVRDTTELLDAQILIIQDTTNFVNKIRGVKHLNDVDYMWNNINDAKESFISIENCLQNIEDKIFIMQGQLSTIDEYVTLLKEFVHLQDIDSMWSELGDVKADIEKKHTDIIIINENIQKHQNNLDILNDKSADHKASIEELVRDQSVTDKLVKNNRQAISQLEIFKSKVDGIEHLYNIDAMWEQGNALQSALAATNNNIASLQEKIFESENSFTEYKNQTEIILLIFKKKLKYVYLIAGGSLGLALLELILIFAGVI